MSPARRCKYPLASRDCVRGFTLVEIMVVVVIIGLLAVIAITAVQRARERSYVSRYINDFRQFESAFQRYIAENGSWPPSAPTGVVPAGMAGYLPSNYTVPAPLGGGYIWAGPSEPYILLRMPQAADSIMQRVDAALDDGDLATGAFIKINGFGYGYHVQ